MAKEIERKYLVIDGVWKELATGTVYRQGYLSTVPERTVRVRVIGDKGYLTIKGLSVGATRDEFEYEIPGQDANELLRLCEPPIIEKTRYKIEFEGLIWEVDEFSGENTGLIIAEVELRHEHQEVILPAWVGDEVTYDPKYFNANLVKNPYQKWKI